LVGFIDIDKNGEGECRG